MINRFRWGELSFKPIFWFPRLEFSLLFLTCLHLKGRGPLRTGEVAVRNSAVIAEPALRTVGPRLASQSSLLGLCQDSTSQAAGSAEARQLWWVQVEECSTLTANADSQNAGGTQLPWYLPPTFFAYSSCTGFKQEIVFCRGSGPVNQAQVRSFVT